ncbi:hypothetical protein KR044_012935, partial [Drosophila immigrans]
TWSKICRARYSEKIRMRFQNILIEIGDSYAIFQADANQFLVSIGSSPLLRQQQVELQMKGQFVNAASKKVVEGISAMTCLPYRFKFTEEIVEECTGKAVVAKDTILSYPRYEEMLDRLMAKNLSIHHRNCSHFPNGTNCWPLIIASVLLIFLMFFYR